MIDGWTGSCLWHSLVLSWSQTSRSRESQKSGVVVLNCNQSRFSPALRVAGVYWSLSHCHRAKAGYTSWTSRQFTTGPHTKIYFKNVTMYNWHWRNWCLSFSISCPWVEWPLPHLNMQLVWVDFFQPWPHRDWKVDCGITDRGKLWPHTVLTFGSNSSDTTSLSCVCPLTPPSTTTSSLAPSPPPTRSCPTTTPATSADGVAPRVSSAFLLQHQRL